MIPLIFRLMGAVLLMACLIPSAFAQEQEAKEEWNITAECQMIIVPQKIAFGLLPELNDEGRIEAAWERVQQMIEKGEVELLASLVLTGKAGKRAVCETIEEMRYPTEFDPPNLPDKIPQENAAEVLKAWPVAGVTPTAYETRNVGQQMELEVPQISDDGSWLNMDVVVQHVRFLRWVEFDAGRLASGDRISVNQPYFHTMKNTQNLRVRNGQRVLIGVHKVPEKEQKAYELFLLQARAAKTGASASK